MEGPGEGLVDEEGFFWAHEGGELDERLFGHIDCELGAVDAC